MEIRLYMYRYHHRCFMQRDLWQSWQGWHIARPGSRGDEIIVMIRSSTWEFPKIGDPNLVP